MTLLQRGKFALSRIHLYQALKEKKTTPQFGADAVAAVHVLIEAIPSPLGWAPGLTGETESKSRITVVGRAVRRTPGVAASQRGRAVRCIRVETGFEEISTTWGTLGGGEAQEKKCSSKIF